MIRHLTQIAPDLATSLHYQFGHCPARCDDGSTFRGPSGRVYRSSRRSLTLQCTQCGLLWTMTIHQIAKAARRLADPSADLWAEWAAGVDDRRGRRPAKASRRSRTTAHPHAPKGSR